MAISTAKIFIERERVELEFDRVKVICWAELIDELRNDCAISFQFSDGGENELLEVSRAEVRLQNGSKKEKRENNGR